MSDKRKYTPEKIKERYQNPSYEDLRFTRGKADGLEPHYTKKYIRSYLKPSDRVIEIGCATGYYGMFLADKCESYLGVDLTPENISFFNEKINESGVKNITTKVGDATNLDFIEDETFDLVLVLGPMYHLPFERRHLVFSEAKRICKKGGTVMFSYINKAGAYFFGCFLAPATYPNKAVNKIILEDGTDDIHSDVFFFTMPEEMEGLANESGLKIIKNIGINFSMNKNAVDGMNDEQFEAWLELNDFIAEHPSCTGLSNHGLLICEK